MPVERHIDHAARQRCLAPAEVALQARAMELEIVEAGPVASLAVERLSAPGTARKKQAVAGLHVRFAAFAGRLNRADAFARILNGVRADSAPYPDADAERLFTQSRTGTGVLAPDHLERADEPGGPLELLSCEQAQGVAHEHCRAASAPAVMKTSPYQQERNQPEVRLRFAATGLKPDQIQSLAIRVVFGNSGCDAGEQKSELERPPVPRGVALAAEVLHLAEHRPVGESEGQCPHPDRGRAMPRHRASAPRPSPSGP